MKTLKADAYQRVRLPDAKPNQSFAYEYDGCGSFKLTLVEPVTPTKAGSARLIRKGGRTYLEGKRITDDDVKRAMADFP